MPLCRFQLHATGSEIVRLGWVDTEQGRVYELSDSLANLLALDAETRLGRLGELRRSAVATFPLKTVVMRAPVDEQEVWAAGVTYEQSRDARMEESAGEDLYQRVYDAERPELFLKATGWRCVGDGQPVGIRADSTWDVPEPELTVVIDSSGEVFGYTVGNDVSSRSIEGENALYLSQAKIYHASCALGPWIVLREELGDASNLEIRMSIDRDDTRVYGESISTARMHRSIEDLISHLYRALLFPSGAVLMTGTGLVPPSDFTLQSGDQITIEIDGIGKLTNQALRLESR
ncbi:MAG: fumarylacetoacetate hydrolase family protein [Thermomicrobiales bacterium]